MDFRLQGWGWGLKGSALWILEAGCRPAQMEPVEPKQRPVQTCRVRCAAMENWADLPFAFASLDMITESRVLQSSVLGAAVCYQVLGVTGAGITEWHRGLNGLGHSSVTLKSGSKGAEN